MPDALHDPLVAVAGSALERALTEARAIVLGGSHARGEAIWVQVQGRRRCLSDLDLHVIVADDAAEGRANAALETIRGALRGELEVSGLAAPVDLGVHTRDAWRRLPARPATLELRRSGVVLAGDPRVLDDLPDWTPGDVPAEEIRLLLDNRAFELLGAAPGPARAADEVEALRACHAQYKCALDLAGVDRLASGGYEPSAAERVRAARAGGAGTAAGEPAWDAALGWMEGRRPEDSARAADWWRIAAGWVERWRRLHAPGAAPADFESVAIAAARRARIRRRLRLAFRPEIARGLAPPLSSRLLHALQGTPQHRLNASAGATLAVLVLAHDDPASRPALQGRLARLLRRLGAVPCDGDEARIARALRDTWDRWVMGGTRGVAR